jgi:hypothetical protein
MPSSQQLRTNPCLDSDAFERDPCKFSQPLLGTVQGNQARQQTTGTMAQVLKKPIAVSCRPGTRIGFSTCGHDHGLAAQRPAGLQADCPVAGSRIDASNTSRVENIDAVPHEKQPESLDDVLRLVRHREHSATPLRLELQAGFGEKGDKIIREKGLESWVEESARRAKSLNKLAD